MKLLVSAKVGNCLSGLLAANNRRFVYIFLNFQTVANVSFLGYLHMRQRFFGRYYILTLTFFGTKNFSSRKIFKNYLHTYTKPLNAH